MQYRNLTRIVAEFVNRDGVPTALIADNLPDGAYAEVEVDETGLSADIIIYATDLNNDGTQWKFRSMEDRENPAFGSHAAAMAMLAAQPKKGELGTAGKVVVSVVALAILVPFIGIIWAWAAGVVRGLGGLW